MLPALSLVASPGKRAALLTIAQEAERRGFAGIACPSLGGAMSLCVSLSHVTSTIPFWTSIQPIYLATATETAATAAHIHELSGGRFSLGLGVSHAAVVRRIKAESGMPLSDTRAYVDDVRAAAGRAPLPPVILATLRNRMLDLALEIADGAVWANASLSHFAGQVQRIPTERRDTFFVGNMIPVVIDEDVAACREIHRRTMMGYVILPNYRNYWKEAGYVEEMEAMEEALAARDRDRLPSLMSDAWIDDCTLSGTATQVRDGLEAWADAGCTTPIAVMSSTSGGQLRAVEELFAAYA
jgi:alkanesulfonate monooxygenase SsuD/methylene tetrahydromethanopterin reductase-like flavin-dependent oxidoreductase (luciferase family)